MKVAVAPREYERPLLEELGERFLEQHGRLIFFSGEHQPVWAQNIWLTPERFEFKSISEAVKKLRSVQRNWHLHSVGHHRRAKLIQEQLPPIKAKLWPFPSAPPKADLGAWTLLDEHTLLFSPSCSSAYPDGEVNFAENKTEPPSRAYLKLWETFTLEQRLPAAGERTLDMGSSPGGWTWVLDQLGCEVISVDKAPLSPTLKLSPRVRFVTESAFALDAKSMGHVDWFFSDVICYPSRLLQMVKRWIDAGVVTNFVCTLKFQDPTDHATVAEFLKIPGSHVRHLSCNKHELTWILLR